MSLDRTWHGWCTLAAPRRMQPPVTGSDHKKTVWGISVNKAELIDLIADKADITKASATRVLDAALEGIVAALRDGEQVALVGFGTFSVKQRAERQGRNPKTGEPMLIAASRTANFKPGKMLRDAIG